MDSDARETLGRSWGRAAGTTSPAPGRTSMTTARWDRRLSRTGIGVANRQTTSAYELRQESGRWPTTRARRDETPTRAREQGRGCDRRTLNRGRSRRYMRYMLGTAERLR